MSRLHHTKQIPSKEKGNQGKVWGLKTDFDCDTGSIPTIRITKEEA
jgi:hypothetical protein